MAFVPQRQKETIVSFDSGIRSPCSGSTKKSATVSESEEDLSLLSNNSWGSSSSSSSSSSSAGDSPLKTRLKELEYEFYYRDKAFRKVQAKNSPHLNNVLWEYEAEYRRMRRSRTMMEYLHGEDAIFEPQAKESEFMDCDVDVVEPIAESSMSRRSSWLGWLHLEVYTTIPTFLCLTLHCLLHIGIYESIGGLLQSARTRFLDREAIHSHDVLVGGCMVTALILLRASGDLYWWATDPQFRAVKFHLHNRLRLGDTVTRILLYIRRHDVVRACLFLMGYYVFYFSVNYFHERAVGLFDFSQDLLQDLPSKGHNLSQYMGDLIEEADPSAGGACRDIFLQMQAEAKTLKAADEAYTFQALSVGSYEVYWAEQITAYPHSEIEGLVSPFVDWSIYVCLVVFSGGLLMRVSLRGK